uniref:Ig-like domain-containing protein n=1 Tax=uncultured Clostridium sp. TaxID=59620 RepID=UPI0028EBB76A
VYASSDSSIATVDGNGLVTVSPTAAGGSKALIVAKNGNYSAVCTVTVPSDVTLSNISVNPTLVTVDPGNQQQLIIKATMTDGSTQDVTNGSAGTVYSSTNTAIATVDANGLVTVNSKATTGSKCFITAKYNGLSVNSTIVVGTGVVVSSMSIDPTTATIAQGQQQQLTVTATMTDGNTRDVTSGSAGTTYSSSNGVNVKVDANGLITIPSSAATGAKSTVTATNGGKTVSCAVTVGGGITLSSIAVNPTSVTLAPNQQQQLAVSSVMSDGNTNDITNASTGTTYSSSNTAVATVDANGLITVSSKATNGSKVIITARYNGYAASCTVTIAGAVSLSSISVNPTSVTLQQGQQQQLAVTATMSDGNTQDVTNGSNGTVYSSNNGVNVKVDGNGLITVSSTAAAGAKATISVTYGGKTASSVVSIPGAATISSISVSPKTVTLTKGQQQQLTLTAIMSDGSTKDVTSGSVGTTYTTSNSSVATVDANGLVTISSTAATGTKVIISGKNSSLAAACTITIG